MTPDNLQDIVDTDTGDVVRLGHIAQRHGCEIDRHAGAGQLLVGDDAVQRAFELAATARYFVGDEFENITADGERRIASLRGAKMSLQYMIAQFEFGEFDVDDQTAGEPRAHPLIDAFKLNRGDVGGDDDLAAVVDQGVEGVTELLLHRFALQELEIIDEQDIDGLEVILEIDDVARAQRIDEMVHEALRGDEEHAAFGMQAANVPGNGIEQMRLAQPGGGMN